MKLKQVKECVEIPTLILVEAVLMPNKEIIGYGKTLGFMDSEKNPIKAYIVEQEE